MCMLQRVGGRRGEGRGGRGEGGGGRGEGEGGGGRGRGEGGGGRGEGGGGRGEGGGGRGDGGGRRGRERMEGEEDHNMGSGSCAQAVQSPDPPLSPCEMLQWGGLANYSLTYLVRVCFGVVSELTSCK